MDNNMVQSLTTQSATTVVIAVWHHEDMMALKLNCRRKDYTVTNSYQEKEKNVLSNLGKLTVPFSVWELFLELYQTVGQEMCKWIKFHSNLDTDCVNLAKVMSLNVNMTINYKKTAEELIRGGYVKDDMNSFRLACIYCIEDLIAEIWPKVQSHFRDIANCDICPFETFEVLFWVYDLQHQIGKLMDLMEYCGVKNNFCFAFLQSIENNNEVAARYFVKKIDKKYLSKVIHNALEEIMRKHKNNSYALKKYSSGLFNFLFVQCSTIELNDMYSKYPSLILMHLLECPLQNSFLEIYDKVKNFLSEIGFYNVLEAIAQKVAILYDSKTYQIIFVKFWQGSTHSHKTYVINKCVQGSFLARLFDLENTDVIIRVILQSVTIEQRQDIIVSFNALQTLDLLIKKQRWDSIWMLLNECVQSKSVVDKLRAVYLDHLEEIPSYLKITREDRGTFFNILETFKAERL